MRSIGKTVLVCLLLCAVAACAQAEAFSEDAEVRLAQTTGLTAHLPVQDGYAEVTGLAIEDTVWLFLPAFADLDTMTLSMDGAVVEWHNIQQEGDQWFGEAVSAEGETLFDLRVMQSQNLRALFLFSDDPLSEGRAFVDSAVKHENETTGSMAIVDSEGQVNHAGKLRQLRGRGNYSWKLEKKPYQFKLEDRADLLRTGDKSERNRTWVLLAEMSDGTFLHNRIALDLGLEMGIEETSHCEHMDLYYDGEYRGLYLLAEKVEVGEGRMDVGDYDPLIEALNDSIGQYDLETLPVEYDYNRFENQYSYIAGLAEPEDPSSGTYVLEMEHEVNTLSDRCWLRMSDKSVLASKNPENASRNMMAYVSERLEEARRTLQNGGVNPENGRTIEDDFNVEAFARIMLLNEMCYNADSYSYSSSWFILPAGEKRFEPGSPWDFDIGMRYLRNGLNASGAGVKTLTGWTADFYNCDSFVEMMQKLYRTDLKPAVENILLGGETGRWLKPLDQYVEEISASRRMNSQLWTPVTYGAYLFEEDFETEIAALRNFLQDRFAWLDQHIPAVSPYTADTIDLWGRAGYLRVEKDLEIYACPWSNVEIRSFTWEQLTEATEEDYAVWQVEAFIAPKAGYAFENPCVRFGGVPVQHEMQEDGSLRILVTFEDPSYRPVDYYGEDIGTVYNPDFYAAKHPEIAAEYEDDPQGLMDYFCDDGMYEDHMGNAFFRPSEILYHHEEFMEMLGTDWQLYYWEFMAYGQEDDWLRRGGRGFGLEVTDALE